VILNIRQLLPFASCATTRENHRPQISNRARLWPTMGPGTLTGAMAATSSSARAWPLLNGETPH